MDPAPPPPAPRRRRSRLALSLRATMLLVLLLAVPMAWKVNRARAQRRAVAEILRVGGKVYYDYQYSGDVRQYSGADFNLRGKPSGPAWLRSRLGDEYFGEVTDVSSYP